MARLQIIHTTRLSYREPIAETYMEMRVRPLEGVGQRCTEFSLDVKPAARVRGYRDGFGNHVLYFNHLAEHTRIEVRTRSLVETGLDPDAGQNEDWPTFPDDFLDFRPPVLDLAGVRRIASSVDRGQDRAATLAALTTYINSRFTYRREITDVFTQVDQVLALRSGVCQDFAHLFIAVARSLAIPCRYVSGYIHSLAGTRGGGATHAWAEAWLPPFGWIGFDPTNPMRASEHHVRVAVGRDYRDVPPTRGIYLGRAAERMEVDVDIQVASPA